MSAGLRVVTLDTRVYFSANRCDFGSTAVLASRNPQVPSQLPRNHSHFISKELRSCDALRDRPGPDSGVWLRENAIKIPKSPGSGVTPCPSSAPPAGWLAPPHLGRCHFFPHFYDSTHHHLAAAEGRRRVFLYKTLLWTTSETRTPSPWRR